MQNSLHCQEEVTATYMCRICKKSFYNTNALQNHKNTQHDIEDSCSDVGQSVITQCNAQVRGVRKSANL